MKVRHLILILMFKTPNTKNSFIAISEIRCRVNINRWKETLLEMVEGMVMAGLTSLGIVYAMNLEIKAFFSTVL